MSVVTWSGDAGHIPIQLVRNTVQFHVRPQVRQLFSGAQVVVERGQVSLYGRVDPHDGVRAEQEVCLAKRVQGLCAGCPNYVTPLEETVGRPLRRRSLPGMRADVAAVIQKWELHT